MKTIKIKKMLEDIIATQDYSLSTVLAKLLLKYENVEEKFKELLDDKCYSWVIPELISLDFTQQLFDEHYEEIEDKRKEFAFSGMWFDTSEMEDIKLTFVRSTLDNIVEGIADDSIIISQKDSRF